MGPGMPLKEEIKLLSANGAYDDGLEKINPVPFSPWVGYAQLHFEWVKKTVASLIAWLVAWFFQSILRF